MQPLVKKEVGSEKGKCACASCKESIQHARRDVGGHLVVFSDITELHHLVCRLHHCARAES